MPNPGNITTPVSLVSFGRSGSSAIANAFESHPEFSNAGETVNLIFGAWRAVECASGGLPAQVQNGQLLTDDARAARVVRDALLATVPAEEQFWFHKPIGIPLAVLQKFNAQERDEAARWYWRVMQTSFPDARYFTVLRNPFDVVLSARSFWGCTESALWKDLGLMAFLLCHPDSPVTHAIHYDELLNDGRGTLLRLCRELDVPFHESMVSGLSSFRNPSPDRQQMSPEILGRRQHWDSLDPAAAEDSQLEAIARLFDKFGAAFDRPQRFESPRAPAAIEDQAEESAEVTVQRLGGTVQQLRTELEMVKAKHRIELEQKTNREVLGNWVEEAANYEKVLLDKDNWIETLKQRNVALRETVARLKEELRSRPPTNLLWRAIDRLRRLYRRLFGARKSS